MFHAPKISSLQVPVSDELSNDLEDFFEKKRKVPKSVREATAPTAPTVLKLKEVDLKDYEKLSRLNPPVIEPKSVIRTLSAEEDRQGFIF